MLYEARLEKGLNQEELAEKAGTTKSYISKIENNIKEARISTLQKIIELGLGGHLELSKALTRRGGQPATECMRMTVQVIVRTTPETNKYPKNEKFKQN